MSSVAEPAPAVTLAAIARAARAAGREPFLAARARPRQTRLPRAALAIVAVAGCLPPLVPYSIVSDHSGRCLSLPVPGGYDDGEPVQQWSCTHYHMGLQASWGLRTIDPDKNTHSAISIQSGKCLEVLPTTPGTGKNGDIVRQAKCTGADNQMWNFQQGITSTTSISSRQTGKCLQVRLGSTGGMQDGDAIEQWDCNGAKNQSWHAIQISAPKPPLDTGPGELCNACNPMKPACKAGSKCLLLPTGQSVCATPCSAAVPCPTGYSCAKLVTGGQTTFLCAPTTGQCPRP